MLKVALRYPLGQFSKISHSLKLLSLSPPTTQQQIKAKYKEKAKLLHPDMATDREHKSEEQLKKDSQHFIEITEAYKHLSQLTEEQINSDREQRAVNQQEEYRPMREEEKRRHATYSYLNRKYRKPAREEEAEKRPLYKTVPQLFVGMFLVVLYLVEWGYAAYQKSRQNAVPRKRDVDDETFLSMNHRRRYKVDSVQE